jgi:hypothetical protein
MGRTTPKEATMNEYLGSLFFAGSGYSIIAFWIAMFRGCFDTPALKKQISFIKAERAS